MGRDAGAAEAHRLEDAQAEALGIRRKQPQVGHLQVVLDVGHTLEHDHPALEAESANVAGETSGPTGGAVPNAGGAPGGGMVSRKMMCSRALRLKNGVR